MLAYYFLRKTRAMGGCYCKNDRQKQERFTSGTDDRL